MLFWVAREVGIKSEKPGAPATWRRRGSPPGQGRRLLFESLEPRVLLSAAVSDEFSGPLNTSVWQLFDPRGDATVVVEGDHLQLGIPGGTVTHDLWAGANDAPRLLQQVDDSDLALEAKFDSVPVGQYAGHGLVIQGANGEILRFDTYSDGSKVKIIAASIVNGVSTRHYIGGVSTSNPIHLQVVRQGDVFQQSYSYDGMTWKAAGSFTLDLVVSQAGLFVSNSGTLPAYTSYVDYFRNLNQSAPPSDTTAPVLQSQSAQATSNSLQVTWATNEPARGTIEYGTTTSYELGSVSNNNLLTSHTLTLNGLSPQTIYHYRILASDAAGNQSTSGDFTASTTANPSGDTTAPLFDAVFGRVNGGSGQVSVNLNEAGQVLLEYGLTSQYELGSQSPGGSSASHTLTLINLQPGSTYHYRVRATDAAGNSRTTSDQLLVTAPLFSSSQPVIDLWYGPDQVAGWPGLTQRWVNVLGNVADPNGITSLRYRLNGGALQNLKLGPDLLRLQNAGDFNIELDYALLQSGSNLVDILAVDGSGTQSAYRMNVQWVPARQWPTTYQTDFASAQLPDEDVQIIDGKWGLQNGALRTLEPGYDRLIGLGSMNWTDFETVAQFTVHDFDLTQRFAPGVGFVLKWAGHDDDGKQPRVKWWPLGALAWYEYRSDRTKGGRLAMVGNNGVDIAYNNQSPQIAEGVSYFMKARVVSNAGAPSTYYLKLWAVGAAEPAQWQLTGQGIAGELTSGSLLFDAHFADVSVQQITVTPLNVAPPPPGDTTAPTFQSISATPSSSTLQINWTTNEAATGYVEYGTTTAYEMGQAPGGSAATQQSVLLQNLQANTTYYYRVHALDLAGNETVSAGQSAATSAVNPPPTGSYSDEFNTASLDTMRWQFVDPVGDSSMAMTGSQLRIDVPAGVNHDVWRDGNLAPRVMQSVENVDFEVIVKFDSVPSGSYASQGLIVQEDSQRFLRFDFYSDSKGIRVFAASFSSGAPTAQINKTLGNVAAPLYMRVRREGTTWTQSYSLNGVTWQTAGSFSFDLAVAQVGIYAGNAGTNPANTVLVDYFRYTLL